MKIIFNGKYISKKILKHLDADDANSLHILPETVLIQNNLPFFHPDFTGNLYAFIQPGVKINKLGKSIEANFAENYYDEIGFFIQFIAMDFLKKLARKTSSYTTAISFDYCLNAGEFIKTDTLAKGVMCEAKLNDANFKEYIVWKKGIDNTIETASRFFTLKTGDIILSGEGIMLKHVIQDSQIELRVDDYAYLNCRVK
ncbi:MAG: hypothetical protein WCH34_05675 [Bacteroidota bacterium]